MQFILWLTLLLSCCQCQAHNSEIPQPEYIDNPVLIDTVFTEREQMAHVDYLRSHIGIPNKDTINMWLSSVGLPPGNPFCSAAVSHSLDVAGATYPTVRSGLARNFVYQTHKTTHIKAKDVFMGVRTAPAGSIVVYQRGDTIFGHNGFNIYEFTGKSGVYISANTSAPGSSGSESSGGGVHEKTFNINPYSYFKVTDFIPVTYER